MKDFSQLSNNDKDDLEFMCSLERRRMPELSVKELVGRITHNYVSSHQGYLSLPQIKAVSAYAGRLLDNK